MTNASALLRRFTIRTRMLGAIALVLAMFALVGAAGLGGGLRLAALESDLRENLLPRQAQAAALRQRLAEVRLLEKQMVVDYEDGVAVLKLREQWTAAIGRTRDALAALAAALDGDDAAAARRAAEALAAYAKAAEPVLAQIQNGGYDNSRAVDKMFGRAQAQMASVADDIARLEAGVAARARAGSEAFASALRASAVAFGGALVFVVLVVAPLTLLNSASITRPILHARRVAQAIADGDLTQPIAVEGRDEASDLLAGLAQMQTALSRIVGDVRHSSAHIEAASREVAAGNADLSERTERTAAALQATAGSLGELTGHVRDSAGAAQQADALARSAAEVAARGGSVVADVVTTMDEIAASSRRIGDIIGVVDAIAFQTNILALNAAVEAARAGEQGRGFAVVAGEVRSLARRSSDAAREIKALVGSSVARVESGARLVADAGTTMDEIVASVRRVAERIAEVTAAGTEQSTGLGRVNGSVGEFDRMTQQNAALVEQSAAAAASLSEQAARLARLVATFRIGAPAGASS